MATSFVDDLGNKPGGLGGSTLTVPGAPEPNPLYRVGQTLLGKADPMIEHQQNEFERAMALAKFTGEEQDRNLRRSVLQTEMFDKTLERAKSYWKWMDPNKKDEFISGISASAKRLGQPLLQDPEVVRSLLDAPEKVQAEVTGALKQYGELRAKPGATHSSVSLEILGRVKSKEARDQLTTMLDKLEPRGTELPTTIQGNIVRNAKALFPNDISAQDKYIEARTKALEKNTVQGQSLIEERSSRMAKAKLDELRKAATNALTGILDPNSPHYAEYVRQLNEFTGTGATPNAPRPPTGTVTISPERSNRLKFIMSGGK